MKHLSKLLLVAAVVVMAACEPPGTTDAADGTPVRQASMDTLRAEVQEVNERWFEYANAQDYEALVGLYAADAVVITPEGVLRGRDEILADFEENLEGDGDFTTDHIEVSESGDLAYLYGTWSSSAGYSGSYLSVLGNRGGEWLWLADAWNVEETPAE